MAEIATVVFVRWRLIWSWLESLRVFFFYSSCTIILLGHRSLPFEEGTNKIAISLNCGNEFESNLDMSPPGESWYWFATNYHRHLKEKGQFIYKWENSQRNHFFFFFPKQLTYLLSCNPPLALHSQGSVLGSCPNVCLLQLFAYWKVCFTLPAAPFWPKTVWSGHLPLILA